MIQPGSTLAHYEIVSALGKGGMGEVWRARDSKLGREVAIKTLPGEFAQDEERLARFEREAKLLASLNHPNIATIHGMEDHNGTRFLVLELVEGDTLADRLKHGAIPVEESLKLALQIAEALEAAHEKGVIHRDLKPANIKVTADGKVKVLDFGLAKAFAGDSDVDLSQSPTISAAATQQGIVLGTAAYMSPEQARGLAVDKRADVWAFGCVLYEMLTGRPVFAGDDVSLTLARVLERQPEFKSLPTNVHPKLLELLERCLEKEAKNRWHDIADVRVDIQKVLADPGGVMVQRLATLGQAAPQSRLPWVVAVLGILVAGVAGWYLKPEPPPEPRPVTRFDYELPEGQQFRGTARPVIALSPDGSSFVYNASGGLYLRSMDDLEARLIPGTEEGLTDPFLSPDGLWVGYWSGTDGQLKKVAVSGGAAVTLCDATNPFDARWSADDTIVFGQPEGIMRVSANGGTPELVVERAEDANIGKPQILPDGQSVLFSGGGQVEVQSLETGARKVLVPNGVAASYVRTGHLVYAVEGVLFGVPFDLANLEVTGGPVPLVEGVWSAGQVVHYDVSDRGSLVYVVGSGSATADRILALVDRSGGVERLNVRPAPYMSPRLSPDGMQLAVQTLEGDGQDVVWVYDLSGDTAIRQLTQEGNNSRPIWTPDGERLTFASDRDGTTSIWWQPADGSGVAEPLTTAQEGVQHWPESWSPDGRTLSFQAVGSDGEREIWTLSLDGEAAPEVFYTMPGSLPAGSVFSPDGNWLAYYSRESGGNQVYVQPFPATGVKHQLTQNVGVFPLWSGDGSELFYRRTFGQAVGEVTIMGVDVSTDGPFRFGNEQTLPIEGNLIFTTYRDYDITPDGKQFLMVFPADETDSGEDARPQINIVLNFFEELKERVPVP